MQSRSVVAAGHVAAWIDVGEAGGAGRLYSSSSGRAISRLPT